jgi:hypothetical protein
VSSHDAARECSLDFVSEIRPHMVRSRVGGIAVIVHDSETPSDEEWASWVSEYRITAAKLKGVLVYSLGGGPNGKQRSEFTPIFSELDHIPPTCIVTSSVAMRGIVTAIRWFVPQSRHVKIYPLADLDRALADLGLAQDVRAEVTRSVHAHLKTLGVAAPDARRAG